MVNYNNSKIYKLVCDDVNLVYYGSTTQRLSQRLYTHKSRHNKCSSKKLFDVGNVKIILVEKYPCSDKQEMESRERYYIENNKCVNQVIPTRTRNEWLKDNKNYYKQKSQEYYYKHRQQICKTEEYKQKKQEYYYKNQETILEKQKETYNNNKEKFKQKQREWYVKNKEKINEKRRMKRKQERDKIKS